MRLGPAGFKPKRRWGQNFLIDPGALAAIAAAFRPSPGDHVLEIGPGDGALTRRIAPRVAALLAVEVDPELAATLREEFETARVRILEGDVLSFEPERLLADAGAGPGHPVRILGNLPYNIATVIILRYLTRHDLVRDLMVMVQREVAERILAPTHTKEFGSLTVLCRTFAKVERIRRLRPGSFRPRPKVESEVIRLALHDPGGAAGADPDGYARFVHECFGQRRKTFLNNLARVLASEGDDAHERARSLLVAAAIDPGGRPEEVPPEGFERLYARLKSPPEKRIDSPPSPV
ncbi:MAG TPA: 16S rRNA (adenine(1518)-N(6)/adenine(1519)-N(6))-dimethyltransferase RsmA [Candidatus Polarisedimenticolia bacterium]|jgi:16S rRNA (adenine1518-N6/adenine1519-N6)-dimethyltransferase|nr:16S rRNA (adenine(1518)-N(6)/adenine(1519)-N(6))-dimethyltransferase RsmA [Candidatus Polarisedimenticolia bacterium]